MIEYLITGISLGLVAGISPGPLLTLVITETIKYNRKEGVKIALTPLLTDAPIMLLAIFVLSRLSQFDLLLGIISFLGAGFILLLAFENLRLKSLQVNLHDIKIRSYRKGIIANFLSPHPYLFWVLVGAPTTIKAVEINFLSAFLFVAGFYTFIVGTKIVVAFISEKSKDILNSKYYIYIIRFLAIILVLFAVILIIDGLEFITAP